MADTNRGPISPEMEELLAFRVAKRALVTIAAMLAPVAFIVGWLGYDKYTGLEAQYKESTERLVKATELTQQRADSLRVLADSLRRFVHSQTTQLANVNSEADHVRTRYENFYSDMTKRAAEDRTELLTSVNRTITQAHELSARIARSAAAADSAAQIVKGADNRLRHLDAVYFGTHETAQKAMTIAQESGVQTVGAGRRQHLYGTPFDIYFSGASRDALRNFMIAHRDGATIKESARHPSSEIIKIDLEGTRYLISVVNILDIPGGLLRLNGSSRADAASFRVNRITAPANEKLSASEP